MSCEYCNDGGSFWRTQLSGEISPQDYRYCHYCGAHLTDPEPLSLEQLKQMHEKPIYIVSFEDGEEYWAIADTANERRAVGITLHRDVPGDFGAYELYGVTWAAYKDKPHAEKEKIWNL